MMIAVLDFGGQYTHLLAQRIRKLGVYSEIVSPQTPTNQLQKYSGLILSGGPHSVHSIEAPRYNTELFTLQIPLLGICYGHQLLCKYFGARVQQGQTTEYGPAELSLALNVGGVLKDLFHHQVWMSHSDTVVELPSCLRKTASTEHCSVAAVEHMHLNIYGVQFHPEVKHSVCGDTVLKNFLNVCGRNFDWSLKSYLETMIPDLQTKYVGKSVFMLLSGGVDSTVAFTLLNKALGPNRVIGLHIDNGFMRYNESVQVLEAFRELNISNLHIIDASQEFYDALKDVVDPQQKRNIIGNLFIDIQEGQVCKLGLGKEWLLGQGTIYPDTIESGGSANSHTIKTHHNRVARIQELITQDKVVEPLAELYKDEVREIGELLGLPHDLVWRHPFPGPGLAIRILCNDQQAEPLVELESDINVMLQYYEY